MNIFYLFIDSEEFLKKLYAKFGDDKKIDRDLLRKVFLEQIEQTGKTQKK